MQKHENFDFKKIQRNLPKYLPLILGFLSFYLVNKVLLFFRIDKGETIDKLNILSEKPWHILKGKLISFNSNDLMYSVLIGLIVFALLFAKNQRKSFVPERNMVQRNGQINMKSKSFRMIISEIIVSSLKRNSYQWRIILDIRLMDVIRTSL